MGGFHVVFVGDFMQHDPVQALAIYKYSQMDEQALMRLASVSKSSKTAMARLLWTQIDTCIMLKKQHRFNDEEMLQLVEVAFKLDRLTDKEADFLIETLQSRCVMPSDMPVFLAKVPTAIILRRALKPALNIRLVKEDAIKQHQRLIFWRSSDSYVNGKVMSNEVQKFLNGTSAAIAQDIPTYCAFFPGCKYVFSCKSKTSKIVPLCKVTNYACVGTTIFFDKREPIETAEDLKKPYRFLSYVPM